jgi:LmbE family N-acetylglucosaminyl deacetylase
MKAVVGIFAHPDDEVFGPGGTLAKFVKDGYEVSIICVTDGDAGENSLKGDKRTLGEIRKAELADSAKILGIKNVYFLGYHDGSLNNNLYHEIAGKIEIILDTIRPDRLLTMEHRGVSGHIDHIAVSMITSFVFEKAPYVHEIWYYALTEQGRSVQAPYFIYFPPGYKKEDITTTVPTADVIDLKVKAMHAHKSQQHDIDKLLGKFRQLPKEENFIIRKKS